MFHVSMKVENGRWMREEKERRGYILFNTEPGTSWRWERVVAKP